MITLNNLLYNLQINLKVGQSRLTPGFKVVVSGHASSNARVLSSLLLNINAKSPLFALRGSAERPMVIFHIPHPAVNINIIMTCHTPWFPFLIIYKHRVGRDEVAPTRTTNFLSVMLERSRTHLNIFVLCRRASPLNWLRSSSKFYFVKRYASSDYWVIEHRNMERFYIWICESVHFVGNLKYRTLKYVTFRYLVFESVHFDWILNINYWKMERFIRWICEHCSSFEVSNTVQLPYVSSV